MSGAFERILDLLYPNGLVCCLCAEEAVTDERSLCPACAEKLRLPAKLPLLPGFDGVEAGLLYTDEVERAMYRFKYGDARWLRDFFVQFMVIPDDWHADIITAVPLHKRRMRRRGYNQSILLAEALGRRTGIAEDASLLSRVRDTASQTHLNAEERRKNVRDAFVADPRVEGKRIIIVDDVRTTGATLIECAAALRRAGAARIYALTACANERT